MNKMVMLVYNEALDDEIMEILNKSATNNYTKITGVFGKGNTSGTHLGNDIWPGRNNILYVASEEKQAEQLLSEVRQLRKNLGKEGIKVFILPLEEMA